MGKARRDEALANESAWWNTGHALNEASDALALWIQKEEFSSAMKVGETVACIVTPVSFSSVWRARLICEMLYAFAVENWLKGLLVAKFHRSSRVMYKSISEVLETEVDGSLMTDEEHIEAVLRAFDLPQLQVKVKSYDKAVQLENTRRVQELEGHRTHQLIRLADAAGVILDRRSRAYLNALEAIVQIGRYPAHMSKEVGDLEPILNMPDRRAGLNRVIKERYDELLAKRWHSEDS